jgi:hypothetical protein
MSDNFVGVYCCANNFVPRSFQDAKKEKNLRVSFPMLYCRTTPSNSRTGASMSVKGHHDTYTDLCYLYLSSATRLTLRIMRKKGVQSDPGKLTLPKLGQLK